MADLNIREVATRTQYTVGSAAQTTFSIPFPFFKTGDIVVYDGSLIKGEDTDYTITGTEATDGGFTDGTVTFLTGVTNTEITIIRRIRKERTTDFPPSGGFNIRELNKQLDQIVATQQDLQRQINQKIGVVETDFDSDQTDITVDATGRANKFLGFDPTGKTVIMKDGTTTGTATTVDSTKVPTTAIINVGDGLAGGGQIGQAGNTDPIRMEDLTANGINILSGTIDRVYQNADIQIDKHGRVISISDGDAGTGGGGVTYTGINGIHIDGQNRIQLNTQANLPNTTNVIKNPKEIYINTYGQITRIEEGSLTQAVGDLVVEGVDALSGGGKLDGTTAATVAAGNRIQLNMVELHTNPAAIVNPTTGAPIVFNNADVSIDEYGRVVSIAAGQQTGATIKVAVVGNGQPYHATNCATQISDALLELYDPANPTATQYPDPSGQTTTYRQTGGVLYFPPGLCNVTGRVSIPAGVPIIVMGAGIGVTFVRFSASADGGFEFNMSGVPAIQGASLDGQEVGLKDMTIQTAKAGGTNNVAIQFNGHFSAGAIDPSAFVNRVHIQGATDTTYWRIGVDVDDCPHFKISEFLIDGQYITAGRQEEGTSAGIEITSTGFQYVDPATGEFSPNYPAGGQPHGQATEYHVTDGSIFFCHAGIHLNDPSTTTPSSTQQALGMAWNGGDAEGLYMTNCGLVANNYGILCDNNTNAFLSLQVTNSHFSNFISGINGKFEQCVINGNNFYNRQESGNGTHSSASTMIALATTNAAKTYTSFVISNNFFVSLTPNANNLFMGGHAISIGDPNTPHGITGLVITGNFFQWSGEGSCLLIQDTAVNHTITGNRFTMSWGISADGVTPISGNPTQVYFNSESFNLQNNAACLSGDRAMIYTASANPGLYDVHLNSSQVNLPNNTLHVRAHMTKGYDTRFNQFTGQASLGRIHIPPDGSVHFVRVGATALISNAAVTPAQGMSGIRIVHYSSASVAYQASFDLASSYGQGYVANGLTWGGVALDTSAHQANPSMLHNTSGGSNCVSGIIRVNPGDYFQLYFMNITQDVCNVEEGCQMWMEVIEGI